MGVSGRFRAPEVDFWAIGWPQVERVLDDLREHGIGVAPHVASRLIRSLHGDVPTIRAVAALLAPSQRFGRRALPRQLPLVPEVEDMCAGLDLDDGDRRMLLLAALCEDGDVDVLLAAAGSDARRLIDGPVSDLLILDGGRFRFTDPRVRIWLRASATTAQATAAHERLHAVYVERENLPAASWHRARASLRRVPSLAPPLLDGSRRYEEEGDLEAALRFAEEAVKHAARTHREEAVCRAGELALDAGYATDAVDLLGGLFPHGGGAAKAHSLGALIVASSLAQGRAPGADHLAQRPSADDDAAQQDWARASAWAATISAEHGDRARMRLWLSELAAVAAATDAAAGELLDAARRLSWLLTGERADVAPDAVPMTGGMLGALSAAARGDIDGALNLLEAVEVATGTAQDPLSGDRLLGGGRRSPLTSAYRAVAKALLLFWRGDIEHARAHLAASAVVLPVAAPFAGLAAVLARRLDLAVHGRLTGLAQTLTESLPRGVRVDHLVDRAIQSHLAGSPEDAASLLRLWEDRGAPAPALCVPGLDELSTTHPEGVDELRRLEPPELAAARGIRARIRDAAEGRWRAEHSELAAQARTLCSPFSRGRVEAMLGMTCVVRGEDDAGRRHLALARSLFLDAGASAWARAMDDRLTRLGVQDDADVRTLDPLGPCRTAWERLLTSRELEVAMLVVGGAANREIAASLHVSVRTVEAHLGRVFGKFDVRSRVELTVLAHRTARHL